MRDAVKTLYEHWVNVHKLSTEELAAFEAINKATDKQAVEEPLHTALIEYSDIIQFEAFREGVLTALSILHPLSEKGDT